MVGIGGGTLLFRGEALALLVGLVEAVSGHALADGGPHPEVVERWVVDACRTARNDPDAATEHFLELARSPLRNWEVLSPADDLVLPEGRKTLQVAGCEIMPGVPDGLTLNEPRETAVRGLDGQVITTSVAARDMESARTIAYDRFESARAILGAATGNSIRPRPDTLIAGTAGEWMGGGQREERLLPWPVLNQTGSERAWSDGWHELSEAAAGHLDSEWAERVLIAARWMHRSRRSWFTAERIAACFAALESLVLPEGTYGKGRKLASQISRRWTLKGWTEQQQRQWLEDLYAAERTSAVHLGQPVKRDLEAQRLEWVTHHVLRWGIWHLSPFHRAPNGPCASLNEAFDPDAH